MNVWIMAFSFVVLGIIVALFAHRIAFLINKSSLRIFRIAPWLNLSGKDENALMDEWSKSRLHTFEVVWLWGIRVMGVLLALGGMLVIYILLSQS